MGEKFRGLSGEEFKATIMRFFGESRERRAGSRGIGVELPFGKYQPGFALFAIEAEARGGTESGLQLGAGLLERGKRWMAGVGPREAQAGILDGDRQVEHGIAKRAAGLPCLFEDFGSLAGLALE